MVTYAKISPNNGEPQRYSWETQKKKKKRAVPLLTCDNIGRGLPFHHREGGWRAERIDGPTPMTN